MKTIARMFFVVALLAAVSQIAFATPGGSTRLPDAGASAVLVAMGTAGLVAARRFFGKK